MCHIKQFRKLIFKNQNLFSTSSPVISCSTKMIASQCQRLNATTLESMSVYAILQKIVKMQMVHYVVSSDLYVIVWKDAYPPDITIKQN